MCLRKKMFWGRFSKNVAVALNLSNCWAGHHLWEGFMISLSFPLILWRIASDTAEYALPSKMSLKNTCHHLWIFPTAIPLPITQSSHGLEGMDKENSLGWFFSVIPPKTKTIWNELEILRHIYQSGGDVGGPGSCRSPLGDPPQC